MRDLKFRAWDNVDYMSTPFSLQDLQEKTVQFTSDCKIMQYTGLKDKNGKEIYEGDILRFTHHGGYLLDDCLMTVLYHPQYACFGYNNQDPMFPDMIIPFSEHDELDRDVLAHVEVIANIYETKQP